MYILYISINFNEFADRKVSGDEMPGLLVSHGRIWSQQRRIALRTLRDFGFGKTGLCFLTLSFGKLEN